MLCIDTVFRCKVPRPGTTCYRHQLGILVVVEKASGTGIVHVARAHQADSNRPYFYWHGPALGRQTVREAPFAKRAIVGLSPPGLFVWIDAECQLS